MSQSEIDINKIITELVLESSKSLISSVSSFGKTKYEELQAIFNVCFRKYLNESYKRYSKTKTLLYRDKPVSIHDFFIDTNFKVGKKKYSTENLDTLMGISNRLVFIGTAGCGKSTLLRYLFIKLVEEKDFGVPIMLELRNLNTDPDISVKDYLFSSLKEVNKDFQMHQFEIALESGKLNLVLDGFDEIDPSSRKRIEKEVLSISREYPNTSLILASRPDDIFDSWQEFTKLQVLRLTKDQTIELITKLDYDSEIKESFLSELKKGLYERHIDFLSNPLLLTMMLLTYEQIAEIPSKMHIFYNQAFETLFNKHDALKSLYKRKSYSSIPIDDFKHILSAFSITSYSKRNVSFSREKAITYLDNSKKLTGIDFSSENFLRDLLESVCILYKDGIFYTFTHRSFQEYFAAYFLSNFNTSKRKEILKKLVVPGQSDNVLFLLYEMNSEAIEKDLIIPVLQKMLDDAKEVKGGIYKYIRILDQWYEGIIHVTPKREARFGYRMSVKKISSYLMFFIFSIYKEETEKLLSSQKKLSIPKQNLEKFFSKASSDEGFIPFRPINKEKHEIFDALGCKEFVESRLMFVEKILNKLEEKYHKRAQDIDSLLFSED